MGIGSIPDLLATLARATKPAPTGIKLLCRILIDVLKVFII